MLVISAHLNRPTISQRQNICRVCCQIMCSILCTIQEYWSDFSITELVSYSHAYHTALENIAISRRPLVRVRFRYSSVWDSLFIPDRVLESPLLNGHLSLFYCVQYSNQTEKSTVWQDLVRSLSFNPVPKLCHASSASYRRTLSSELNGWRGLLVSASGNQ